MERSLKMEQSLLRLFNGVYVEDKQQRKYIKPSARTIEHGYIMDPAIRATPRLMELIENTIGLSGKQLNASFHKLWDVVKNTTEETLARQQIRHYITTYLFSELGIFDQDTVYIPKEVLELPEISLDDIPLVVIHALDREEIREKVLQLGGSGVALKQETLEDIMCVVEGLQFDASIIKEIKNRELKSLLYKHFDMVPTEPTEFLRYVVAEVTGESLLIKNSELIHKIKTSDSEQQLDKLLQKAPKDLASIFFRYKPLFLALKKISKNKRFFNQLRKRANTMHKPLPKDYLNSVTAQLKRESLDLDQLHIHLAKANVFRKLRLACALLYRLNMPETIVHVVRNLKGWATDFEWPIEVYEDTEFAFEEVLASIEVDIRKNVEGKIFYIPDYINYTLPATEKQFTGNFPTGTSVFIPDDTVVGIHWTDTGRNIDLDFSLLSVSGKMGWDASWRNNDRSLMFSGDMTVAPHPDGASEFFYISEKVAESFLLKVNYYNYRINDPVKCDIIVAKEEVQDFDSSSRNYIVNPNNVLVRTQIEVSQKQNVIGFIEPEKHGNRVYLANMSLGKKISSRLDKQATQTRVYLANKTQSNIGLEGLLIMAGATVVRERPEEGEYIDLSPETLDKTTILNLLQS